jgi:hypothetical protein
MKPAAAELPPARAARRAASRGGRRALDPRPAPAPPRLPLALLAGHGGGRDRALPGRARVGHAGAGARRGGARGRGGGDPLPDPQDHRGAAPRPGRGGQRHPPGLRLQPHRRRQRRERACAASLRWWTLARRGAPEARDAGRAPPWPPPVSPPRWARWRCWATPRAARMLAAATEAIVRERFRQGIARGATERTRLPPCACAGCRGASGSCPRTRCARRTSSSAAPRRSCRPSWGRMRRSCSASCWCATFRPRWRATRRRRAPPAPAHAPRWTP